MSRKPVIAANKPVPVDLREGEQYYFCVCGRSKDQPFRDEPHKGLDFKPKRVVPDESGEAYLCQLDPV